MYAKSVLSAKVACPLKFKNTGLNLISASARDKIHLEIYSCTNRNCVTFLRRQRGLVLNTIFFSVIHENFQELCQVHHNHFEDQEVKEGVERNSPPS